MSLVINEGSFSGCKDKYTAEEALNELIKVLKHLREKYDIRIQDIYGERISLSESIIEGIPYSQFINAIDRDKMRILLSVMTETRGFERFEPALVRDGKDAYGASYAFCNDGVMISFRSKDEYKRLYIEYLRNKEVVSVRNISTESNIYEHADRIVVRIYIRSDKHRKEPYTNRKGERVSPMDLSDDQAQRVLNHAFIYENRLYGVYNGIVYSFEKTLNNEYHGYRNDDIQEDKKKHIIALSNNNEDVSYS